MAEEQAPRPDASDDDAAWLAALRGEPVDSNSSPAAMEGMLIREAMLKWPPAVDVAPIEDSARLDRLLDRARAEGLLGTSSLPDVDLRRMPDPIRTQVNTTVSWWTRLEAVGFRGAHASLAIAAVLVVATGVWLSRPDLSRVDEGSIRTAPDAVVVLRVPNPEMSRDKLVDALVAEGILVTRYTRFGRLGVDADLPRPLPNGIVGVLRRHGLAPPADGVLQVEYEGS